jgi:p-methyltransferase
LSIDAIIIANDEDTSLSGSSPFKLHWDGITADIQVIVNLIKNKGHVIQPIDKNGKMIWSSSQRLNGTYLLSYLLYHRFQVELINNYFHERDRFIKLLQDSPRVVIVSTTFIHTKKDLHNLVSDIRSLAPDIFIIAGGPFVNSSYRIREKYDNPLYRTGEIKNNFLFFNQDDPLVDLYIISARGENLLGIVLDRIKKNQGMDDLPNLAFFEKGQYRFTRMNDDPYRQEWHPVEWNLLPDNVFQTGVASLQASTGCPFKCTYCNFSKDPRLLSVKPLDQLVDEMRAVAKRGIKYVWFVDDNFRLGKEDMNLFCKRIIAEDIHIRWMTFIRADSLLHADLDLLRDSGCRELQLGLESADPHILENMNKKMDPPIYAKVINDLLSVGIDCSCYFISGFPGETEETIHRTKDFIKNIEHPELDGALSWSIYPFMLAPLSPIFEDSMRKKYDLTGSMHQWRHKTMNSEQARVHIRNIFFEIEKSGPIYRGDNQELLRRLDARKRKNFIVQRHILSRINLKRPLKPEEMIDSFLPIVSDILD